MVAYRATGAEHLRTGFLAWLAEACGKVGQTEEGLTLLAEGLAVVEKTGERMYEAELYRLKGELTLQQKSRVGIAHRDGTVGATETVGGAHPTEEETEACFLK